ncbi:MAG: amino acid ABC transporter permease [Lachnospiraceae bacterium]|nr:amino acid ABC transporter permease [Lachnospiraceae bacterium]
MDLSMILQQLGGGMVKTVGIFVWTLALSLPLGLLISFGRMAKNKFVAALFKIYISVMRGTPLMLQLLVVYFGPYYLFKINISGNYRFIAIIIGFVLNYAAYFAEIYRSGIESMPIGQYEAAKILGYSKSQTFTKIILLQVIKRILPSITNEVITLVKDTSLAFSLAYMEMFTIAKQIAAANTTMMPFVVAAIFYYVFNLLVAVVMEYVEKRLGYYK